ncbi:MBL fold metallo-hydrolase [Acidisphaera sp. L21]|jgi:glyoxylase-like metal-dependent hydrolase (beta-lactamase superfamily II)|uniref:MBL fold metallo-hydrolase n=1 Tax=Acidisphaera sp. L21 TaxID=1641851 RepID=UPI00131ABC42|nr:MBL fold metallo-hydrolase [Acidisphaera sp. L21]
MSELPTHQVPGVHHRRIGDVLVTALSDGFLEGSLAVLQNISQEDAAALLVASFRPVPRRTSVNCFLIRSAGRVALIDCGCADSMQPTAGKLFDNLAAAGVDPAAIDTVFLTHMHPDHSNALADASGAARFPAAELRMHERELAYWNDDAEAARVAETKQGVAYFPSAQAQMAPYRGKIRTFQDGEVFPGVTAVPLPGHTPGHTGYRVGSGSDSLLIWGDIAHVPEVQVPRPEVTILFDVDPAQAQTTRRAILASVTATRQLVAGMHLHFPGYAHVREEHGAYRIVPEAWRLEF